MTKHATTGAIASKALITGFPGFIGKRLARRLLERHPDLALVALVEPRMRAVADRAAAELGSDRIDLITGDITLPGLGLDGESRDRLAREVQTVFHLAAVYDLAVPAEVGQRVNVEGTGNVLEFCERCVDLDRLNYVSTAYVAGDRRDVVYEHELAVGQGFKNYYESTKFQAEVWVREMMSRVPTTIYRPAIVVGDSQTGETQKFDGPYFLLSYIAASLKLTPWLMQVGAGKAPFNVVPVDFVIDALTAAAGNADFVGETLHLVDPNPVTAGELFRMLAMEYSGARPAITVPPALSVAMIKVPLLRARLGGAPPESLIYLNHPVQFDTRRARLLLERCGIEIPSFAGYIGPMVGFFKQHENDPAFRNGTPKKKATLPR